MRVHSPTSTRFPYTTLFRSRVDAIGVVDGPLHDLHAAQAAADHSGPALDIQRGAQPVLRSHPVRHRDDREIGDRKSTRLNSSHVASSYAVFCLKKKRSKSSR